MNDLKVMLHQAISKEDFSSLIGLTLRQVTMDENENLLFEFGNDYGVSADMMYFTECGVISVSHTYSKDFLRAVGSMPEYL